MILLVAGRRLIEKIEDVLKQAAAVTTSIAVGEAHEIAEGAYRRGICWWHGLAR